MNTLNTYDEKIDELENEVVSYREQILNEIDSFFEAYINEVSVRAKLLVDRLGDGAGTSFIKNDIYEADKFLKSYELFLGNIYEQLNNKKKLLLKNSYISEYKFIQVEETGIEIPIESNYQFDFSELNTIKGFSPRYEDDIFSTIGNMIGKFMFMLRKSSITQKIIDTMKKECETLSANAKQNIMSTCVNILQVCATTLNQSFKSLVFQKGQESEFVNIELSIKNSRLYDDVNDVNIKEILYELIR